jgi:hypothetical protein
MDKTTLLKHEIEIKVTKQNIVLTELRLTKQYEYDIRFLEREICYILHWHLTFIFKNISAILAMIIWGIGVTSTYEIIRVRIRLWATMQNYLI